MKQNKTLHFLLLIVGFLVFFVMIGNISFEIKIIITLCLFYSSFVIYVFYKDLQSETEDEEEKIFYEEYLSLLIQSIDSSYMYMRQIKYLKKDIENLTPTLKHIKSIYLYLNKVIPPNVYKEIHENVLLNLKEYLDEYDFL